MRLAFHLPEIEQSRLEQQLAQFQVDFSTSLRLYWTAQRKRMAIFVSRESHCLFELLWKRQYGELDVDIPLIISNHPDHAEAVERMGYPFMHIPVDKAHKEHTEAQQLELVDQVDFIVLARYMQILTPAFITTFGRPIINIHHSFLPAFVGARPYERAYERGVKIIGATAHYVTAELDAGPIIEQDVQRVEHSHTVPELKAFGRQIERSVLARAVAWHVEDRVIIHDNKTIVF